MKIRKYGVYMGSPLAPFLANLFMGHYKSEILFYRRYVDWIFFVCFQQSLMLLQLYQLRLF